MKKRRGAFNSETSASYIEHQISKRLVCVPKMYWGDEDKIEVESDFDAKAYLKKFKTECLKTTYQQFFNEERFEQALHEEEIDMGNQLVVFLHKLYYSPHKIYMTRPPYTSTRIFGHPNLKSLSTPYSGYQDTFGRTAGETILKNLKKVRAVKLNKNIWDRSQNNKPAWVQDFILPQAEI